MPPESAEKAQLCLKDCQIVQDEGRVCEWQHCHLGEHRFAECLSVAAPISKCLGCVIGTHIQAILIPELDRIQRGQVGY